MQRLGLERPEFCGFAINSANKDPLEVEFVDYCADQSKERAIDRRGPRFARFLAPVQGRRQWSAVSVGLAAAARDFFEFFF